MVNPPFIRPFVSFLMQLCNNLDFNVISGKTGGIAFAFSHNIVTYFGLSLDSCTIFSRQAVFIWATSPLVRSLWAACIVLKTGVY